MTENRLSESEIKHIIARVIDNALDARKDREEDKSNRDFYDGKCLAYYEVLDTIKNELIAREADLKEFNLDVSLENNYL